MEDASPPGEPSLDKARHIKYWTRCLKTLLPHRYTGNESNRMYLAFLIISALDLLDAWHTVTKDDERAEYIDWVYHCQHPDGGFRMWPGTDFGERSNEANAKWDPANVPATYFALAILLITGDDMKRVNRAKTLRWLCTVQRPNGLFGETLVDGQVEGGSDPRYGYCAAGVFYLLHGSTFDQWNGGGSERRGIDLDSFVQCVLQSEAHDGGIADEGFHEPHAGYTFCSLGALRFFKRLKTRPGETSRMTIAPADPAATLRWLASRQTDLTDPDSALHTEFQSNDSKRLSSELKSKKDALVQTDSNAPVHQSPDKSTWLTQSTSIQSEAAGMNGRMNKVADTCYAWWGGASCHILGQPGMYDHKRLCNYLLDKTQHPVLGGFGKFPGDLPDLYHSCLGLAALGISGCGDVKPVDSNMCISRVAAARLPTLWSGWEDEADGADS